MPLLRFSYICANKLMMKRFYPLFFLLIALSAAAQDQQWGSYFSYYNVVDLAQSSARVFSASESAMFTQNQANGELKTITSVDGLKADGISAIYHSNAFGRTLVGNNTGLLIVVNNDGSIVNKIDIVQETTVAASKKKINHITENNGIAYIATDYGVSAFNLATLEFIDTYYLGPNGAEVPVLQSAVHNGYLYVITSGYGIRRGELTNPNLNDYSQWQEPYPGTWHTLADFNGTLFVTSDWAIYRVDDSGNMVFFGFLPSTILDMRVTNNYLVATSSGKVVAYNDDFLQAFQINTVGEPAVFTCAAVVGGKLFVGTTEKGVFSVDVTIFTIQNITPNGPLHNDIFALQKSPSNLWAVFGGYSTSHTPDNMLYGVSKYGENGWISIPDTEVLGARSISDITVNPNNENEVYLNSYQSGLLKVVDDVPVILYNDTNSSLEREQVTLTNSIRVIGGTFDSSGKLWMMNTRTKRPLKRFDGNAWTSYSFEDILPPTKDQEYGIMALDKNGTKWIPSTGSGLVAFNEGLDNKYIVVTEAEGLPSDFVNCVAIDHNNRVWIGTIRGLRTISSIERFTTEDVLTANNIVIMEDGLPQELFFEQTITDIRVDGANNKWVGTAAGAFLVSPDGQNTLFHFTKENSPLPSNIINDIEIDDVTGEVFFATDKGMVSYKGTSTAPSDDLSKVFVYPNPVRPGFEGDVKISGLIDNANIKITDIEGNLVYETTSEGGTVLWDTRAFGKHKVASGVYMIFIASEEGTETKVKKVMIVR